MVSERNTTRACSSCGSLTGPTGLDMLVVRVRHERLRPIKRCYDKDEGWPLEVAFQKVASNRPLLLRPQVRGGERVGLSGVALCA
jgi:hypothetical protein